MPNWKDASDELKALLEANGAENVFDYDPNFKSPDQFKDLATGWDDDTNLPLLHAWFMTRRGIGDERGGGSSSVCTGEQLRGDSYVIEGFYGYGRGGKTYYDWQDLIEDIMDALLQNISLGDMLKAARATEIGYRELGDYLCHYTRIEAPVSRRLALAYI
jgi:hypothetical protein